MATIVLFDAYPIAQLGFFDIMGRAREDTNCLAVSSIDEFRWTILRQRPDLLILTINTPKVRNPFSLMNQCRAICPDLPIVFYDEQHGISDLEKWLKLGVSGYLLKTEPSSVLVQCVDVVLGNGKYLSPEAWARFIAPWEPQPQPGQKQKLGRKEFEIARHLSAGKSTSWIANTLGNKPSTISTVKKRIFSKLNVNNVVELCRIMESVIEPSPTITLRTLSIAI